MANSAPDTPSSDHTAMQPYRTMVEAILGGVDTMRKVRDFLPRFPNESADDYEYRLNNSKFTNIFADIVDDLSARPFAEPVKLSDKASPRVKALSQDIDGRGNNLHVFASNWFHGAVAYSVEWVLVEFTKPRPRPDGIALSLADEQKQGLRPYWVRIEDKNVLAAYTAVIGGQEQFVHVRLREFETRRDCFDEVTVERVRVLNREPIIDESGALLGYDLATYELWERDASGKSWSIVAAGPITIGVIALVPFMTGRREAGSWRSQPPLKHAATLQIEHYQQETSLKMAKEATAFPMLSAGGVAPQQEGGKTVPVPVGPKAVLYAPPYGENGQHGKWEYVEISGESLKFLASEVEATEKQLRELGRQPLTAQSGNLTVVTTAFAAQKGNSAIQAWALGIQDAINQALMFTAMWLKEPVESAATATVFTDFALDMGDDKGPDWLRDMAKRGRLSKLTEWQEARRRNVLSADFDPDEEDKRIEDEMPGQADEIDMTGALPPLDNPQDDPEAIAA